MLLFSFLKDDVRIIQVIWCVCSIHPIRVNSNYHAQLLQFFRSNFFFFWYDWSKNGPWNRNPYLFLELAYSFILTWDGSWSRAHCCANIYVTWPVSFCLQQKRVNRTYIGNERVPGLVTIPIEFPIFYNILSKYWFNCLAQQSWFSIYGELGSSSSYTTVFYMYINMYCIVLHFIALLCIMLYCILFIIF